MNPLTLGPMASTLATRPPWATWQSLIAGTDVRLLIWNKASFYLNSRRERLLADSLQVLATLSSCLLRIS
jgi:hypothetical protein